MNFRLKPAYRHLEVVVAVGSVWVALVLAERQPALVAVVEVVVEIVVEVAVEVERKRAVEQYSLLSSVGYWLVHSATCC